ncbi:MAG: hypothetical protein WA939_08365 [Nodosilinea sp.]
MAREFFSPIPTSDRLPLVRSHPPLCPPHCLPLLCVYDQTPVAS